MNAHFGHELSDSDASRLRRLREEFEQACQSGERPSVAAHVAGLPEPLYSAAVFELVRYEVRWLRDNGDEPTSIEYLIQFPNQSEALIRIFDLGITTTLSGSVPLPAVWEDKIDTSLAEHLRDNGFELMNEIGQGDFGRVFRASRIADGEIVAIKILDAQPTVRRRETDLFLREMEIHAKLVHPAIVPFYQGGVFADRIVWFAMQFVDGTDLQAYVETHSGRLEISTAVKIVLQVLDGLYHFHRVPPPDGPFVHRDVKPRNILIASGASGPRAVLSDFGLAKNYEQAGLSGITETGMVCGTPLYMSPEQLKDSKYLGPECDVFAMGAVLYFALTGRTLYDVPPDAGRNTLLQSVLHRRIVPIEMRRADVPESLRSIVYRALRKDLPRCFHSANQMKIALGEALHELES